MNKIKNFFKRLEHYIVWHEFLYCKHCCLWCKFYKDCVEDVNDIEERLNMNKFFDQEEEYA